MREILDRLPKLARQRLLSTMFGIMAVATLGLGRSTGRKHCGLATNAIKRKDRQLLFRRFMIKAYFDGCYYGRARF